MLSACHKHHDEMSWHPDLCQKWISRSFGSRHSTEWMSLIQLLMLSLLESICTNQLHLSQSLPKCHLPLEVPCIIPVGTTRRHKVWYQEDKKNPQKKTNPKKKPLLKTSGRARNCLGAVNPHWKKPLPVTVSSTYPTQTVFSHGFSQFW